MTEDERREEIEHRDTLLDLRAILKTPEGWRFFKYLFKHFDIAKLPEMGLDQNQLMDRLGVLRAGQSIFELASQADSKIAGEILAVVKKEEYEEVLKNLLIDEQSRRQ